MLCCDIVGGEQPCAMGALPMKLTERLRIEHQIFRKLLDLMELSLSLPREQAVQELRVALRILLPAMLNHERMEDQLLFPTFSKQAGARAALLGEYRDSHKDIWKTLGFLQDVLRERGPAEITGAAVERLLFLLREHMLEEDRVLFPAIEEALGPGVLDELGERAALRFRTLPASGAVS